MKNKLRITALCVVATIVLSRCIKEVEAYSAPEYKCGILPKLLPVSVPTAAPTK